MNSNTINDSMTMPGVGTGAVLANRYRIIRQLGQGGMGSVWLAEDTQLDNKQFAIKMLPSILVSNKRAYRQLKDEALVAMKLTHPNIVTLRAFEENNGNPFLVMDYIEGQTLDDYLAENGKLTEEETVRILRPIAAALDYAHGEGVVHRDVKPANVMIRNDGHPFILDFGIAREIQDTLTRVTGKLSSGTLLYMSPEQLRGQPPKAAQDIYSFAAMAYECLKGEPPFSRGQIEFQILNEQPEPPPGGTQLVASVMAGLAKKPEDRPATCTAVLEGKDSNRVERAERVEGNVSRRDAEAQSGGARRPAEPPNGDGFSRKERKERKGGGAWKLILAMLVLGFAAVGGWWYYNQQKQEAARIAAAQRARAEAERKAEEERKAAEEAKRKADEERKAAELRRAQEEAEQRAEEERKAKEEAKRKAEEARLEAARKDAAAEIRLEAKVQQGKVSRISGEDGFKARKDALEDVYSRAEALFDEKTRRWSEAAQGFSNYVAQCEALIALDGERQTAVASRTKADRARNAAVEVEAEKYAATRWAETEKLLESARADFGNMQFVSATRLFSSVAEQFGKCVDEAKAERERQEAVEKEKAEQKGTETETTREMPYALVSHGDQANAIVRLLNSRASGSPKGYADAAEAIAADAAAGKPLQGFVLAIVSREPDAPPAARLDDATREKYLNASRGKIFQLANRTNNSLAWYLLSIDSGDTNLLQRAALGGNVQALNAWGSLLINNVMKEGRSTNEIARVLEEALGFFKWAAGHGDANGQYNLGMCYARGLGTPRDDKKAFDCFRSAAEKGHPDAINNIGWFFREGRIVKKDLELSTKWFKKSAEYRNAYGEYNYGLALHRGEGIKRDDREAARYFKMAADGGCIEAINSYGLALLRGEGVAQDELEAVKTFRRAAEKGFPPAMENLAYCYEKGKGVKVDDKMALLWRIKAKAARGDRAAQAWLQKNDKERRR